jgi:hypothetical protein
MGKDGVGKGDTNKAAFVLFYNALHNYHKIIPQK